VTSGRSWERWVATARDWVPDVERAYVEAAFAPPAPLPPQGDPAVDRALAAAAAGAVASRFLAVGTPRSIGLVGDLMAGSLSLYAHRVWFQPIDIRCALDDRAGELGGRTVSLEEALAADIVCIHFPLALAAAQLRRGTHVNALAEGITLDDELRALATIVDEPTGLPALAAGLRDGRQLDELTVLIAGDLAIARRALASRP
jgi:ornithine cyclodeaminase/alanine dehydrogenase-like protein (mu-crystallin family)